MIKLVSLIVLFFQLTTPEETEVAQADKKLNELIRQHNTQAARSFYFDNFILTTSAGKSKLKEDLLKELADMELTFEINETTDVVVRVQNNTAVLTGVLHQRGIYHGKNFDVKLLVTDTWIKTSEGWKILAGHASKKPE